MDANQPKHPHWLRGRPFVTAFLVVGVIGMLAYKFLIGVTPLWLDAIAIVFCVAFVAILKLVAPTQAQEADASDKHRRSLPESKDAL